MTTAQIQNVYNDFAGRSVVDLGCGTVRSCASAAYNSKVIPCCSTDRPPAPRQGMLAIGAALLGSPHVVGVDMDAGALDTAEANVDAFEDLQAWSGPAINATRPQHLAGLHPLDAHLHAAAGTSCTDDEEDMFAPSLEAALRAQVDLVQCAVASCSSLPRLRADTVIMNPPFGTRRKGADLDFLRAAFQV